MFHKNYFCRTRKSRDMIKQENLSLWFTLLVSTSTSFLLLRSEHVTSQLEDISFSSSRYLHRFYLISEQKKNLSRLESPFSTLTPTSQLFSMENFRWFFALSKVLMRTIKSVSGKEKGEACTRKRLYHRRGVGSCDDNLVSSR